MAVTRLIRKAKRNKTVARKRQEKIKLLTRRPVIKNVDLEELKKTQGAGSEKAPKESKKAAEKAESKGE